MNNKSEAIWIKNNSNRDRSTSMKSSSFDGKAMFGAQRSISFASDGSSAHNTPSGSFSDPFETSRRMRASSFDAVNVDDQWTSSNSDSMPNNSNHHWQRSNSMTPRTRNLSRIEENAGTMFGFGDTIQKSMDRLFATHKSITEERKVPKDEFVSMMCEGTFR